MYEFVDNVEVSEYRSYCARILTRLRDDLLEKEINTQFILVGSGARNLVMRDGDGPFDLDYNLRIISMPDYYWDNLKQLKDLVRNKLNEIVRGSWFSDGKDSTSVITALIRDNTGVEFKFDVAIIGVNAKGNLCRLIHNKSVWPEQFTWNEVPNSHRVKERADAIKSIGKWEEVRTKYKELKNMYLYRQDRNHPSFICYVEAVNSVHNKYQSKWGKSR